ncbi:hypothetical protein PMI18_03195 [Pseudomonas sp. GM102]|nr:hypothetical protein PMI18_03195 [Pseudomonas sp. GM102]
MPGTLLSKSTIFIYCWVIAAMFKGLFAGKPRSYKSGLHEPKPL